MKSKKKKKEDFVHLHVHSDMSQLDGCGTIEKFTKVAAKRGCPAIAFTDHGTMRGYHETHKRCEENDIKPIYGTEFYVANDMNRKGLTEDERKELTKGLKKLEAKEVVKEYENKHGIRSRWHLTVWAKNNVGLKNLFKLSTFSYKDGFYYKPRIDLKTLMKYKKGIVVATGCMSSVINERIIRGQRKKALKDANKLRECFGEDLWLEIQPHKIEGQSVANKFALELKKQWGNKARLLATQDAHYIRREDSLHHEVLLCIGTRNYMSDPNRFKFDDTGFHFRSRKQMLGAFERNHSYMRDKDIKSSLDNTILLSEMVNAKVNIDYLAALLPETSIPEEYDSEWDYIQFLVSKGWHWRKIEERVEKLVSRKGKKKSVLIKEYKKRLMYELNAIKKQKFISYFLIVYDICQYARNQNIMSGPGRGSVAGSLVAFLLGITSVDPIEHDLLFERFMNIDRCFPEGTLIKTDKSWKNIEDIEPMIDKVKTRFGYEYVLDKPSRITEEDLIEIKGVVGDQEVFLTTTTNHVIYYNLNGKIKAQQAGKIKPGQELCFEESYLHNLQNPVRKGCLEQRNVFQRMCNSQNYKEKTNSFYGMPVLQFKFYGATKTKILFKEMWSFSKWRQNSKQSQIGFSERYRPFCKIFFRSRFCKIIKSKRDKISIRTKSNSSSRQNNLYSRFLGRRLGLFCRIKRLEKTKQRKDETGKEIFGRQNKNILLSSNNRIDKKEWSFFKSEVRTYKCKSLQGVQDNRKKLSRMREGLSSSCNKTRSIQSLQSKLFQQSKIQKNSTNENKKERNRTSKIRVTKSCWGINTKTKKQNLFFKDSDKRSKRKIVVVTSVCKIKTLKPIKVYDLCINKIHEYYANGILVKNSDLPDIDVDYEDERRQEIIDYLRIKYGHNRVAQISTVGKLSGRQCFKDVARVFGVPFTETNILSSSIIERASGDKRAHKTIIDSFKLSEALKKFDDKYPEVLKHASHLEGMSKSLGIHAAGVVIAPDDLIKYTPLETRKYKGNDVVVTSLDMRGIAAVGLVKLDVLGLKTLTVIKGCLESIKNRKDVEIDLEHLNLNNKEVLKGFTAQDFSGIFQFDTPSAEKLCGGIKFEGFNDLVALNALNRPGTMRSGLAKQWVERKKKPKKREKYILHKKISAIAGDTLGVITFQEHVNRIFIEIAGFDPSEADKLRKKIGKSEGTEVIEEVRDDFVKGVLEKHDDITPELASKILTTIKSFGSYAFNKAHATSYSMIAYWAMYLKTYYPLDFYCALLKYEKKDIKIQQIVKHARKRGIKILPPNISVSREHFVIDVDRDNTVRGSLSDIKGVGNEALKTIKENRPYKSFADFLSKIDRRKCNKGVIEALLKAGTFDDFVPSIKWLIENLEFVLKYAKDKSAIKRILKRIKNEVDYEKEERQLVAASVNAVGFGDHLLTAYKKFVKKNITIPLCYLSDDFYKKYDNHFVYFVGIIIDVKLNQIGDFHFGEMPNKMERKKMFWGARYANLNVEDIKGEQKRIKFDFHIYDQFRELIEKGPGTALIIYANVNSRFESIRAGFAVSLEDYKNDLKSGNKLSLWEKIIKGKHPVKKYQWKNEKTKQQRITNEKFKDSKVGGVFCGVVIYIRPKYDKNGNRMSFIGICGNDAGIEVVCFYMDWIQEKNKLEIGNLIEIAIEKQKSKMGLSHVYNGGGIRVCSGFVKKRKENK